MQKELKRYSKIGDKAGIITFCKRMLTGEIVNISSQRTMCSHINGIDLNFDCALLAFEYLKIIEIDKNKVRTFSLIYSGSGEKKLVEILCERCYEALIEDGLLDINKISFDESQNIFTIRKSAFLLDAAVFRNMLITFNAMQAREGKFFVPSSYDLIFEKYIREKRKKMTLEDLQKRLERQNEIGDLGEIFVLNFEKLRLQKENLKDRVRRISIVDVTAGYDIVSFEDDNSTKFDRFIEVKTYSGKREFHWSKNEIDIARLRRDSYYIYLVDFHQIKEPGYIPEIIRNPYSEVVEKGLWNMSPDNWTVTPTEEYSENNASISSTVTKLYPEYDEESLSMAAEEDFEIYRWRQIEQKLIDVFGGDKTVLVGCYKNKKYLEWIDANGLYNIRLGNVKGSMKEHSELFGRTTVLVLYDLNKPERMCAYAINGNKEVTKEELIGMNYPNTTPRKSYMGFSITPLDVDLSNIDGRLLIDNFAALKSDYVKGKPVFIEP